MNLTTLASLKAFFAVTDDRRDDEFARLIKAESGAIERYIGRQVPFLERTTRLNGSGTSMLTLPDTPILDVHSVSINGQALATSDGVTSGYLVDDTATTLYLIGSKWPMGLQNIEVSWDAGWRDSVDDTIPSANTPTLRPVGNVGWAAINLGVVAGNVTMTQVSNAPTTGEYTFADGLYTFNSTDANTSVTISFYAVPSPIEQACIEMIGLDNQQRTSIGFRSKSIAGESTVYETGGMTRSVLDLLGPFRKRVPS